MLFLACVWTKCLEIIGTKMASAVFFSKFFAIKYNVSELPKKNKEIICQVDGFN